tara:strand:+ start:48814 stop:49224 length:411 start_codon:yes stop_codon:yes gene_type:complete
MEKQSGGCLCREITYNFNKDDVISSSHCHCYDCQKSTGSGKATIIMVMEKSLELLGNLKFYTVKGTDGAEVKRGFCENCGSPLLSEVTGLDGIKLIKAGSLDDASWVEVSSNFWTSSAMPWAPVDNSIHSFLYNPE